MITRFFGALEERGYLYRHAAGTGDHVHMPDGLPRYFPAVYERDEKPILGEGSSSSLSTPTMLLRTVITASIQYDEGGRHQGYKVVYEKQAVSYPSILQPYRTIEKDIGHFDSNFDPIDADNILLKCLYD